MQGCLVCVQHLYSIHICNILGHFLCLHLGLVEAVHLAIYQIDKCSWLTPYKLSSKIMLLEHLNPLLPQDSEMNIFIIN